MSLQYYCDLCTENILAEDRREANYIAVEVNIKRLKTRLHICANCAETFADLFIGKTSEKLLKDMKDRITMSAREVKNENKKRWFG